LSDLHDVPFGAQNAPKAADVAAADDDENPRWPRLFT
jgi:hypothetical protein